MRFELYTVLYKIATYKYSLYTCAKKMVCENCKTENCSTTDYELIRYCNSNNSYSFLLFYRDISSQCSWTSFKPMPTHYRAFSLYKVSRPGKVRVRFTPAYASPVTSKLFFLPLHVHTSKTITREWKGSIPSLFYKRDFK